MSRTKLLILTGTGAVTLAMIVVGVLVAVFVIRQPGRPVVSQNLSEHALTPEETLTEVAPQKDGTVEIRQRLSFEVPADSQAPVVLWTSSHSLGRHPVRDRTSFAMMPQLSDLRAVELSTKKASTRQTPIEVGELAAVTEAEHVQGFAYDRVRFDFRPQDDAGKTVQWSEGRHVAEFTYTLDQVFLSAWGEEFFALPLRGLGLGIHSEARATMRIEGTTGVYCPSSRSDFALVEDCEDLFTVDESKSESASEPVSKPESKSDPALTVSWKDDPVSDNEVIAFDPPPGMTERPAPADESRR